VDVVPRRRAPSGSRSLPASRAAAPAPPAPSVDRSRSFSRHAALLARAQGVDRVMYKFQKHAVDNCRVFKSYSLQHIFGISPEVAERVRQPEARLPTAGRGAHTADEEAAIDAELAQLRERAHAVGARRTSRNLFNSS
jgi:hypothetical protein